MTRRYSSVTAPRSAKLADSASNSRSSQPAPTPSTTRPPDSTSVEARDLAVKTGSRYGSTSTEIPSVIEVVSAASHARSASGSWITSGM